MQLTINDKKSYHLSYPKMIEFSLALLSIILSPNLLFIILIYYLNNHEEKESVIFTLISLSIYALKDFVFAYQCLIILSIYALILQYNRKNQLSKIFLILSACLLNILLFRNITVITSIILLIYLIKQENFDYQLLIYMMLTSLFAFNEYLLFTLLGLYCLSTHKLSSILLSLCYFIIIKPYFGLIIMLKLVKDNKYLWLAWIAIAYYLQVPLYIYLSLIIFLIYHYYDYKQQCFFDNLRFDESNYSLKRRLQVYSGIFDSLASFYRLNNPESSYVLKCLAKALQEPIFQQLSSKETYQIIHFLKQYQINLLELKIYDNQIFLRVRLSKEEIFQYLIPLLEQLFNQKLRINKMIYHFIYLHYELCLAYDKQYTINSYGASLANPNHKSGDVYSIFQFKDNYILMICDGMGNGERAYESAKLISSLFQKFILSGMMMEEAITCINYLVQSECFSTMDVMFINPSIEKAYLLKSAACPTYIIRNHELIEIQGNALPLGIIDNIDISLQEINLNDQDMYLLVSDGISEQEIKNFVKRKRRYPLKSEKESLLNILKQNQRKDDSTFILAKVNKI